MSEVKVNKISPRSGTTVTLGDSGDTIAITSGASLTGFTSTGIDDNATSTAITIDSSENVLVSTADTTPSENNDASGISLRSNGQVNVSVDGGAGLDINRKTSDGQILRLRKDGTDVGSIGTYAGDLIIGTTDTGLRFDDGASAYIPWNTSTNLATNGTISLGFSTVKYKDLYLGGNIYLGGTGGSNALDDYEEGTWTPELKGDNWTGSLNYTQQQGIYIKVGRLVFVSVFLAWNANNFSAGSNRLDLQGLPFATSNQSNYRGGITIGYASNAWTGLTIYQQAFRVESSASKFGFNFSDATDGHITTEISSHTNIQSSGSFMMGGTYATD